mgnify:CR=1 FL=1
MFNFLKDIDELSIKDLKINDIQTVNIIPYKYNFPRIRNLPNKIICEDETGKIDIVYFNSREGYLRKLFPLNEWIIISGKINFFKKIKLYFFRKLKTFFMNHKKY